LDSNNNKALGLPWGKHQEYARAQKIASIASNISLIPKSNLHGIATALALGLN